MPVLEAPSPPLPSSSKLTNGHHSPLPRSSGTAAAAPRDDIDHDAMSVTTAAHLESEDDEDGDIVEVHGKSLPWRVEVRLEPHCQLFWRVLSSNIRAFLLNSCPRVRSGQTVTGWEDIRILADNVERIRVGDTNPPQKGWVDLTEADVRIDIYKPVAESVVEFSAALDDDDTGEHQVPAATVRDLPSIALDGLWDNLIYPPHLKASLLNLVHTSLLFADLDVDPDIVALNRLVLLHGPPGTGKTSLCRALSHKLAIRLSERYPRGKLIEINSHSLFSKWFSESGKLVQKLFSTVTDMVEDQACFVVVLIDEVESLTIARDAGMRGSEPGDALRVVNALLTQLDKLRRHKNVLVLTTSNLSHTIGESFILTLTPSRELMSDKAFIDRADIKEYVGLPIPEAIYWILLTTVRELMAKGLIEQADLLEWDDVQSTEAASRGARASAKLAKVARACHDHQLSGRFLRRLPGLVHARHIRHGTTSLSKWVEGFARAVEDEVVARTKVNLASTMGEKS